MELPEQCGAGVSHGTGVQVGKQLLQQLLQTVMMMTGTCPRRKEVGPVPAKLCGVLLHAGPVCQQFGEHGTCCSSEGVT